MDSLEAILARVRHAAEPEEQGMTDEDYDDDYSSCEEAEEAAPLLAVSRAQDVQDTQGAVLQRLRDLGVSEEAALFVKHGWAHARPEWRPLSGAGAGMCAAFAGKRAKFEVAVGDPEARRVRVSGDALLLIVGALYYASFGRATADVYTCGWTPEAVERNYELAKRAALQLKT